MHDESSSYDSPPLPQAVRPRGLSYVLGTWTGRLLTINTVVFLFVSMKSGSLFLPDTETLLLAGAKDPVGLASGEFWRLLTPVFLHIGIVHFAVNGFMLHVIGYQLERLLGGAWFVGIYLASGVAGNVASALFSVHLSAGASGAIFGLLGVGFFLESSIGRRIREVTGRRPRSQVYAMTVLLNLAFGFMVPFIDNAAHVGGLLMGAGLTLAMVNLRPNRLTRQRKPLGALVLAVLLGATAAGAVLAVSPAYQVAQLAAAGAEADSARDKYLYYSQALAIDPDNAALRLERARLLLFERDIRGALPDLRELLEVPALRPDLDRLVQDLEQAGLRSEAWQLRVMLEHAAR